MKIVEENENYFIAEWYFKGMPILIRRWKQVDVSEIKVTDYFAKANGYRNVSDMVAKTVGKHKVEKLFGGVPEWIRVNSKGDFFFLGMNRKFLN